MNKYIITMANNLIMYRGDDKTWNLTFTDSLGNPVDITSCAVFLTVKFNSNDPDSNAAFQIKQTNHSDPTHGKTTLNVNHSLSAIAIGTYYYDIQLVDSSLEVTTITSGTFTIKRDITLSMT